jgi:hypothetical protein
MAEKTCAAFQKSTHRENICVPKLYPTWAIGVVLAFVAPRKISNLRGFSRAREFESHPLRHSCKSLIFLPLNSWCLCWWPPCETTSVNAELIAMRICLRTRSLCDFSSKHQETHLPSPGGGEGRTLAHSYGKRSKKLGGKERLPQSISRAISAIIVNALL